MKLNCKYTKYAFFQFNATYHLQYTEVFVYRDVGSGICHREAVMKCRQRKHNKAYVREVAVLCQCFGGNVCLSCAGCISANVYSQAAFM